MYLIWSMFLHETQYLLFLHCSQATSFYSPSLSAEVLYWHQYGTNKQSIELHIWIRFPLPLLRHSISVWVPHPTLVVLSAGCLLPLHLGNLIPHTINTWPDGHEEWPLCSITTDWTTTKGGIKEGAVTLWWYFVFRHGSCFFIYISVIELSVKNTDLWHLVQIVFISLTDV